MNPRFYLQSTSTSINKYYAMKFPKSGTLFPLDFARMSANIGTAAKQWDMLLVEVAVAKPVSFYNNYKIDCKVNLEAYTKLARQSSIICFSGTHL